MCSGVCKVGSCACFGVIVPDKARWTVVDEHISPQIALEEFVGVGMWEEKVSNADSVGGAWVLKATESGVGSSASGGSSRLELCEFVDAGQSRFIPDEATWACEDVGVA